MARPGTERAVAKFLAYFDQVRTLYKDSARKDLELYKTTDSDCLAATFEAVFLLSERGLDFIAECVHRLAWSQCLGNANHRTTVLFVGEFLDWSGATFPPGDGTPGADQDFEQNLNQWIHRSQALIRRRGEPGFAQARLEPRHREISREWIRGILAPQSEALAMMGPQRLMNFIS